LRLSGEEKVGPRIAGGRAPGPGMGALVRQEAAGMPGLAVVGAEGCREVVKNLGNEVREMRLRMVCTTVADVDLLGLGGEIGRAGWGGWADCAGWEAGGMGGRGPGCSSGPQYRVSVWRSCRSGSHGGHDQTGSSDSDVGSNGRRQFLEARLTHPSAR
jgi:hypothetical protein